MNKLFEEFNAKGFIILRDFISDESFSSVCKDLKEEVLVEFGKLKKTGGSLMGNLNVSPGVYAKTIFQKFNTQKFQEIIEQISRKKISNFDVISGGNLNFQYKYNQHFHTDSKFKDSFLIVNVVTEDIYEDNGPLEILPGTQKENFPYWKIAFKKSYKIIAKKGDLIIRTSNLWHRGTKNISKNPRLLLAYTFRDKINLDAKLDFEDRKLSISNNIFKTNLKGILKENFYTRFSYIYIIYRFLRSIITKKHFH